MTTKYREMVQNAALTGTPATALYSAGTATTATIHAVTAANTTAAPIVVNLYKVASGGTVSTAVPLSRVTVPAGATRSMQDALNHKLQSGTTLYADGNGATLNVSGLEFVAE